MLFDVKIEFNKPEKPIIHSGYLERIHGWVSKICNNKHYGNLTNEYIYSLLMTRNPYDYHYGCNGIEFKDNPFLIIRMRDTDLLSTTLLNIAKSMELFDGIKVKGVTLEKVNVSKHIYRTPFCSPVRIGKHWAKDNKLNRQQIERAERYLKRCVLDKAKALGYEIVEDFSIKIREEKRYCKYLFHTEYITGHNLVIDLNASENLKEFILWQGIGRSNGIGFGFLK